MSECYNYVEWYWYNNIGYLIWIMIIQHLYIVINLKYNVVKMRGNL